MSESSGAPLSISLLARQVSAQIIATGNVFASPAALQAEIIARALGDTNLEAQITAEVAARQAQVASLALGLNYQGTWNAATNSPALASGTGTPGFAYVVGTAGSTTLDGVSAWTAGSIAYFNSSSHWVELSYGGLFALLNSPAFQNSIALTGAFAMLASAGIPLTASVGTSGEVLEDRDADGGAHFAGANGTIAGHRMTATADGTYTLLGSSGEVLAVFGNAPPSSYSTAEIAARDAAACLASLQVKGQFNATAQRPTMNINHYSIQAQSEGEGWQTAWALLTQPTLDTLQFGGSPRPMAVAAGVANVQLFAPVGGAAFEPLQSVNQNINTGALVTVPQGGFSGLTGSFNGTAATFTATTGEAKISLVGGVLTSTPVGGSGQPTLDFTQVFSVGQTVSFFGLTGAWAYIEEYQYPITALTPTSITVGGGFNLGQPTTPVSGVSVAVVNNNTGLLGEESGVTATNYWRYLQLDWRAQETAGDPRKLLLTNAGIGGLPIAAYAKGATPDYYNRPIDAASQIAPLAAAQGKTACCVAVEMMQGGTDGADGTLYAAYQPAFQAFALNYQADMQAAYGQARRPLFATFQVSGANASDTDNLGVPRAQLDTILNFPNPDAIMIAPGYFVPDQSALENSPHWMPNGELWFGLKKGQVYHKVLDRNEGWLPLYCNKQTYRGQSWLLEFHVPEPPLQLQSVYVGTSAVILGGAANPNYGITFTDAAGALPTVGVGFIPLTDETTTKCIIGGSFARPPSGPIRWTIGGAALSSGSTNICDSDATVANVAYRYEAFSGQLPNEDIPALEALPAFPLNNWCCLYSGLMTAD